MDSLSLSYPGGALDFTNASLRLPRNAPLLQRSKTIMRPAQIVLDGLIVVGLLFLHWYWEDGYIAPFPRVMGIVCVLLMLLIYPRFGVYHVYTDVLSSVIRLTKAWFTVILSLILIGIIAKTTDELALNRLLLWGVSSYILQVVVHVALPMMLRLRHAKSHALVIGVGELARHLTNGINKNVWIDIRVIGVLDDGGSEADQWDLPGVPLLGQLDDLAKIIDEHRVLSVYIALPLSRIAAIKEIYDKVAEKHVNIFWVPDVTTLNPLNFSVRELSGVPILALSETPLLGSNKLLKDIEDKVLASLALLICSPVMLLIALLIKQGSSGPVFFRQRRNGWYGEVINVWKFRSMYLTNNTGDLVEQASRNDPRVTPIGRILRATSMDELPQLFNVLTGDMSLVGPRPHAVQHNDYYSKQIHMYMRRHHVKPGMTGLAQVKGYRGETGTLEKMARRVEFDLKYINHWSVWLDLWLLVRTLFVLGGQNAY